MASKQPETKWHPAACIFPMMPDEELDSLAADIEANGQRNPIVMFEGQVLDGRNRWMACLRAGVKPSTKEFTGSRAEALAFVWSLNAERRDLKPGQKAAANAEREKLDAEYAAELKRQRDEASKGGRPKQDEKPTQIIESVSRNERSTDDKIAKAIGSNRTYVNDARKIHESRPDLHEKVKAGELTIPQAKAEIKRETKRRELHEAAESVTRTPGGSRLSDQWSVIAGDCVDQLERLTNKHGCARLIFADPPYNIGVDYGNGAIADRMEDWQYMSWVSEWMSACVESLTFDGSLWVLICDEYAAEYAVELKALGLTIRSWIKWYETFGVNCSDKFNRSSRHLFHCVRDQKRFVFNPAPVTRPSDRQTKYGDKRAAPSGKLWDDVWSIPRLTGTCEERIPDYPTQLPLALVQPIIECASMPGDLVIDPFHGSGTTGVAAIRSKRRYVGIERQQHFVDMSTKRILKSIQGEK